MPRPRSTVPLRRCAKGHMAAETEFGTKMNGQPYKTCNSCRQRAQTRASASRVDRNVRVAAQHRSHPAARAPRSGTRPAAQGNPPETAPVMEAPADGRADQIDVDQPAPLQREVESDPTESYCAWLSRDGICRSNTHDAGPMTDICQHCGAHHWYAERGGNVRAEFASCCKKGNVTLPEFSELPDFLQTLLQDTDARARRFREKVRRYNTAFAFTSIECSPTNRGAVGQGPTCFQICGALYHITGPLEPGPGQTPRFAQLYFYDPATAANFRAESYDGLDRDILTRFTSLLHEVNPHIGTYLTARERLLQVAQGQGHGNGARVVLNPNMELIVDDRADRRRENLPTTSEVAAIIPESARPDQWREIVLAQRGPDGSSTISYRRIHAKHPAYLPLAYPLMFPYGDLGYNTDLGQGSRKVTLRQYFRYFLYARRQGALLPFAFGRLFQQFVVDAWASIDQDQLNFLRTHQDQIRAELYQGLSDAVRQADVDITQMGARVILPSSYIGSVRFMSQRYQDSMAMVRYFARPDIFLTFTANPKWEEITRELLPGQTALDRPDLITRVFEMKRKALLFDIRHLNCFGKFRGCVWTIEYQKRGLPHMHCLIFLHPSDRERLLDPTNIDRFIRAELPTPDIDPDGKLRSIVQSVMIHGPCGQTHPNAPCMTRIANGGAKSCAKHFPKEFRDTTTVEEDGYPLYRRRNNGDFVTKLHRGQQVSLDNRWVVPYCPWLSRKYNAHVNVEVCATVKSVKYIHKYIYKGTDRITVRIGADGQAQEGGPRDEIAEHLQSRYIGPSEACWRIFEYHTHEQFPPVTQLAIHLPGQESVFFNQNVDPEELRQRLERHNTTLTAFFKYNVENVGKADFRPLLYQDFPSQFVYGRDKLWHARQRPGFAIGRMYFVNPREGERYFLRLLLTVVRGPTSFENLRTVDGVVHPTFKAACDALGLLHNDQYWDQCFSEAKDWQTGRQLRILFVSALTHGDILDPLSLWVKFRDYLCDDLPYIVAQRHDLPPDLENAHFDYGLFLIDRILMANNTTLAQHGLPMPQFDWGLGEGNSLIQQECEYDRAREASERDRICSQFNEGQQNCFDRIVTAVENDPSHAHFFLQGPAGTGKTFLYNGLCHYFRAQGKIVLCVASSGIAALLLPGGRTAHSRFKIPLNPDEFSTCNIKRGTQLAELLQRTSLIIWDEVPMQHKFCFEAVHRTLCDIRENSSLFGGIPTLFGGDFAQILPVVRRGSRAVTVQASLQKSFLWPDLKLLFLHENMRVHGADGQNRSFIEWIQNLSYDPALNGPTKLHDGIAQDENPEDLFERIYPRELLSTALTDLDVFRSRSILSSRNSAVRDINDALLERLPGDPRVFLSTDEADVSDSEELERPSAEFLQSIDLSGLPPSRLTLKVGAPIILLRNLFPAEGLCNGTRLVVTKLGQRCIEARILGGSFHGEIRFIPRVKLSTGENELPFTLSRTQLPVQPCFAMTINKAQGQSFDTIGVDLRSPVFTHGQFYVAMSRVTNVRNLSVLLPSGSDGKALNIVYPEVLLR